MWYQALPNTAWQRIEGLHSCCHYAHTPRGECRSRAQWNKCFHRSLGDMLLFIATSSTAATIRDKGASSSKVATWGVMPFGNSPFTNAAARTLGSSNVL